MYVRDEDWNAQIDAALIRVNKHVRRNRWIHNAKRYRSLAKIKLNNEIRPPLPEGFTVLAVDDAMCGRRLYNKVIVKVSFKDEFGKSRYVLREFKFVPMEMFWFNNGRAV